MAYQPMPYRPLAWLTPWPALACGRLRDDAKYVLRDKRIDRPGEIVLRARVVTRIALVCAAALAVAACKNSAQIFESNNDGGWFSKPMDVFATPDWARPTGSSKPVSLGPSGPVAAEELVGVDGRCGVPVVEAAPVAEAAPAAAPADRPVGSMAGDLANAPMPAATPASVNPNAALPDQPPGAPQIMGGVALGMSECDVVRRAGLTGNVNIGAGEKGDRKVVLTYLSGTWPGIYTFNEGRLREVARAPVPETPVKPPVKKKNAKKPVKPKTAATPAFRQVN
jgi:hypothetical protein